MFVLNVDINVLPVLLTKITAKNDGSGGRTYFEGVIIDGYLLADSTTGDGWAGTPP